MMWLLLLLLMIRHYILNQCLCMYWNQHFSDSIIAMSKIHFFISMNSNQLDNTVRLTSNSIRKFKRFFIQSQRIYTLYTSKIHFHHIYIYIIKYITGTPSEKVNAYTHTVVENNKSTLMEIIFGTFQFTSHDILAFIYYVLHYNVWTKLFYFLLFYVSRYNIFFYVIAYM